MNTPSQSKVAHIAVADLAWQFRSDVFYHNSLLAPNVLAHIICEWRIIDFTTKKKTV